MYKRITKAFTLIELLVVIAIIGILTGFIFVSMNGAVNSAKDVKRQADLSTISKAILEYMAQNNNAYPYSSSTSTCNLCNNDSCTNPCTGFYANIQPYLSNIPLDPDGSTYYTYTYSATPKFVLKTTLSSTYVYQYDSTSGFSTLSYSSTCTAATNAKVSCTVITISSTEEACKCTYLSGDGTTTWTVPNQVTQVQYLVVGGGGGGGYAWGGGGGGGGFLTGTVSGLSGSQNITVTVGAGGAINASGNNSVFSSFTAIGGGGGGAAANGAGISGGSGGGGAATSAAGGSGTSGQGTNGGAGGSGNRGGGGGGAGGAGTSGPTGTVGIGGAGGNGLTSSITGTSTYYAGGGGGGNRNTGSGASGGLGGGGMSGQSATGTAGTPDTGGGGGAGTENPQSTYYNGGVGGSGIVVIRYTHP